jgi:HSP20 family protein
MNIMKKNSQRSQYDPWRGFFDVENIFSGMPATSRNALPAVNVSEDEKHYHIDVAAPGFKKEDFHINVNDDVLTISAETRMEDTEDDDKDRQYNRREYSYSSFTRSFSLPENAKDDAISAAYTDGILKLIIPKAQQQVKASKEIKIS